MIFAADIVSMLGTVVAAVALTVLVYQRTGSPALAASVMALAFVPYLVGGILLGAAADRLPARRVLVTCDLASAALVAAMVIPGMPVASLLILLFANGLLAPVYQGARSALLPEVLPPGPGYVLGRSMMRMVAQSAQIIGYGAGGLLLAVLSPRGALAADALSFAASAALLRFGLTRRPARTARTGSMAHDSLTGVRKTLAHRPTRRILLFGWLVAACSVAPEALATPYATDIGQPARAAGFLLMGIPAGTVIADLIVARMLPASMQRRLIVPSGLLVFVPLTAFAASPRLGPAIALLVICGLGSAWMPGLDGLLIHTTPATLRSRAFALQNAGLMFTQGAGFALWGIAAQYVPLTVVIPIAAAAGVTAVVTLRPGRPRDDDFLLLSGNWESRCDCRTTFCCYLQESGHLGLMHGQLLAVILAGTLALNAWPVLGGQALSANRRAHTGALGNHRHACPCQKKSPFLAVISRSAVCDGVGRGWWG